MFRAIFRNLRLIVLLKTLQETTKQKDSLFTVIWLQPCLGEFWKTVTECRDISSEPLRAIQMKNNKALMEEAVELMKKKR